MNCLVCKRKISYKSYNEICRYCVRKNNRLGKIIEESEKTGEGLI